MTVDPFSYLNNLDNAVIEDLLEKYRKDPLSVDESWRKFFEGFEFCQKNYKAEEGEAFLYPNEFKVMNLIVAYRQRGHLFTRTNPVRTRRKYTPTLDMENFGLGKDDLVKHFQAGKELGLGNAKLSDIIEHLQKTYCGSIGIEYYYIRRPEVVDWFISKMEPVKNLPVFSIEEKGHILRKLAQAVLMEKFIHKKFPGHKSFSLEGAESLIPAIAAVIMKGAELGVKEFILGMAHRGRLNVLGNIMQKPFEQIFSEFEGKEYSDEDLLGDVKYHLGYSTELDTGMGQMLNLTLCPNPSHLEAVDPVVEGLARGRIDRNYDGDNTKVVPVLIHGDASIAGQGIVYETTQMADLGGYKTGGTIHLVINNQLGFTTNYLDGRSSVYCTDVAKTIQSPVFHVNADDVEAVVYTVQLAMEFRNHFHKDVFIDLLGYRKYGHNESDEPRFTQPILYKVIEAHPDPLGIYIRTLEEAGISGHFDIDGMRKGINTALEQAFQASKSIEKADITPFLDQLWKDIRKAVPEDFSGSPDTSVTETTLRDLGEKLTFLPGNVKFFRKILKLQEDRKAMLEGEGRLDWAMGELLAYASLLNQGHPVRISGQDSQRGTFSHRHAVLTVEDSEDKFIPLEHIAGEQTPFSIYNSLLSEYGVLGFEYGYAFAVPEGLTIWEAQFGDFNNGTQIIIDQYLSSAEDKWKVMNGLVLFLPHGYEGQGPEHSSARLERFLTLSGHYNWQITNCTTPANLFHLLRRQLIREFRKPLVVFTPKSLLRHPRCVSKISEFTEGGFLEVIDDSPADKNKVTKLVFCSGKIYYDIIEKREQLGVENVAVIRIEQLYPLPEKKLADVISTYPAAQYFEWAQEEPGNMGALNYLLNNFTGINLTFVTRPPSGSPATGSSQLHKIQQDLLVEKALGKCSCEFSYGSCRLHCAEK